ncbi:sigma-B regulation protein RsbU (phosphoserine phosphatase) [Luteibacter sp. UNCMF331Sha3.1]|uniref:SpoIIE family protein phosphatase n=1 Tax=Luteibacter sp. UNCMF331Sha3.1 TaxID=1502760 RepID=UPI0008B04891|nr:SpoIIE family protein phosphatase [Luteibacter sp. UNCMF331Sha3.1]SEM87728.1 sigma-B regulation protein RsbU (phosphoserine phosphatase) [Luteibacter sp. UNCMF331Sha3.1]
MVLRSVATRLALGVLVGSAIVLVVTGGLMLSHTREQMLAQTEQEASAVSGWAATRIEGRLDAVARVARVMAGILGSRRDEAPAIIRDTLAVNPEVVDITAAFIPRNTSAPRDADAPLARRGNDGSLTLSSRLADAETYWMAPWFVRGLNCERGCWQAPFRMPGRSDTLVGYSVAIPGNGDSVAGVADVTISVGWLQQLLGELNKPDHASAFVVDANGMFLAHDWSSYVGTRGSKPFVAALAAHRNPVRITPEMGGRVSEPVWVYFVPIAGTTWTAGLTMPEREVLADLRRTYYVDILLGLVALAGVSLIALVITRRLMAPLAVLSDRAEDVARGELDFALPNVRRRDEVGRLTRAFDQMRRQLAGHIDSAKQIAREQERMASELDIARQIQLALIPEPHWLAADGHVEVHAALRPASAVGGDLYTYFALGARHICVMVGDVSDKGIPAALFMARTITLARTLATHARSPSDILGSLNRELCKGNDTCMFVTLLCGVLETETGLLSLASAGHEQPVLHAGGSALLVDVETGPALGIDREARYPVRVLTLLGGDTVLMYTDGVSEAHADNQKLYGTHAILDSVARVQDGASTEAYIDQVLGDVDAYTAGAPAYDDIALLALTWHEHGVTEVPLDAVANS